jgi:PAS domain S-box-containing protein
VGGLWAAILVVELSTEGLGFVLSISALVFSPLLAHQTLPSAQFRWVMFGALGLGGLIALFDYTAPFPRFVIPASAQAVSYASAGALVLALLGLTLRQFNQFGLRTKLMLSFVGITIVTIAGVMLSANFLIHAELTRLLGHDPPAQTLALQALGASGRAAALMVVGAVVLTGGLALIFSRQLAAPLEHLTAAAERMRQGDLTSPVIMNTADEFGHLALTLNSMTDRLRATIEGLESRVAERTQALAESLALNQRRAAVLAKLAAIETALSQAHDEFEIVAAIVKMAEPEALQSLSLAFVEPDTEGRPVAARPVAAWVKGELVNADPLWRQIYDTRPAAFAEQWQPGEILFINDITTDPRLSDEQRSEIVKFGLASVVIPLRGASQWQGVLWLVWLKPRIFTDDERFLFQELLEPVSAVTTTRRAFLAQRAALVALQNNENQLRLQATALEAAANAIMITDSDGVIQWVNPAFTAMTGYARTDVVGQTPRLLKSGAHDHAFYQALWAEILAGRVWHGRLVNRRKDGTPYIEEQVITPVRNPVGQVVQFVAIKLDITQREQAEAALRASEEKHRQLLASIQSPVLALTEEMRVLYCNEAYARLVGQPMPHLEGARLIELFPQYHRTRSYAAYQDVMRTGEMRETEGWLGKRYLRSRIYRTAGGLISIADDITERKLAEETLAAHAERLAVLYGMSQALAASVELEEIYQAAHLAVGQLMPAEIFFISLLDDTGQRLGHVYLFDRERLSITGAWTARGGLRGQVVATGEPLRLDDFWDDAPPDSPEHFGATASARAILVVPLRTGNRVIGVLSTQSYTPRAYTADHQQLLVALANQTAAAIEKAQVTQSLRQRAIELEAVARLSAAASTILEVDQLLQTVVELTQRSFDFYHVQIFVLDPLRSALRYAAGSGGAVRDELSFPLAMNFPPAQAARTRQAVVVQDCAASPLFLPNPALPDTRSELALPLLVADNLLGVFDVQARELGRFSANAIKIQTTLAAQVAVALQNAQLYAEQLRAVERLQEVDQLKSGFLANMSHELRTPLNSILGFTDVLLEGVDGQVSAAMAHDLRIIRNNGEHLLNLINEVLDLAKIESGRLTLNPEYFDLGRLLDDVMAITRPLAHTNGLILRSEMADRQLPIEADHLRLKQVLLNLVNNAIKFTEHGEVVVAAERRGERVHITVRDTGVGIPPEKIENIFQEFSQVDTSPTRKVGGTGLGLPISRHLVELHGGRLWAVSPNIPGQGSTFFIDLPVLMSY